LDYTEIEKDLISEIKLSEIQAKVFLAVVKNGKMSGEKISKILKISTDEAIKTAQKLMEFGAFIDISESEFESMHPRFTAVNMYRKMCEREKIEFKRNVKIDNIGAALEGAFDAARTK